VDGSGAALGGCDAVVADVEFVICLLQS